MGGGSLIQPHSRPKRTSRNRHAHYDSLAPARLPANKLCHLLNIPVDPCRLAIGPSQQYTVGPELYLDHKDCEVGTVLT